MNKSLINLFFSSLIIFSLISCKDTSQWEFINLNSLQYGSIKEVDENSLVLDYKDKYEVVVERIQKALNEAGYTPATNLDQTKIYSGDFDEKILQKKLNNGNPFTPLNDKKNYIKGNEGIEISIESSLYFQVVTLSKYTVDLTADQAQKLVQKISLELAVGQYELYKKYFKEHDSKFTEKDVENFNILYQSSNLTLVVNADGTYQENFIFAYQPMTVTGTWSLNSPDQTLSFTPNLVEGEMSNSYLIDLGDNNSSVLNTSILNLSSDGLQFSLRTGDNLIVTSLSKK